MYWWYFDPNHILYWWYFDPNHILYNIKAVKNFISSLCIFLKLSFLLNPTLLYSRARRISWPLPRSLSLGSQGADGFSACKPEKVENMTPWSCICFEHYQYLEHRLSVSPFLLFVRLSCLFHVLINKTLNIFSCLSMQGIKYGQRTGKEVS